MKKIFTVMMAVAFAFSVAGFALAAEKAAAPAAAPAAAKSAPTGTPAAASTTPEAPVVPAAPPKTSKPPKPPKPKTVKVTGTIEALDAAAGTFTVNGKKGNVDLKAGKKVKLGGFKVGDKVVVKYAGGTASSVKHAAPTPAAKSDSRTPESIPGPAAPPAAPPAKK